MNELAQNKDGYMVFEDSGTCPLAYGANENWFATYDEAIKSALDKVKENCESFKERFNCNSVMVYEGSEKLRHESHSIPCGRVVFAWSNYYRKSV